MPRRQPRYLLLVPTLLVLQLTGARADNPSPEAFIQRIFTQYYLKRNANGLPSDSATQARIFTPDLADRMRNNTSSEGGPIYDGDPITGAQENHVSQARPSTVTQVVDAARVEFSVVNSGHPHQIEFQLRRIGGAWRIYDANGLRTAFFHPPDAPSSKVWRKGTALPNGQVLTNALIPGATVQLIANGPGVPTDTPVMGILRLRGKTLRTVSRDLNVDLSVDNQVVAHWEGFAGVDGVYQDAQRAFAIISSDEQGTSCPAQFQILDLSNVSPVLTKQFGSCSESVTATLEGGVLRVSTPAYLSSPAETVRYINGRLTK
ncbi:MAG: YbjP/YqhG family protein [Pseudomonadota bacterium]|nr:YbjP/YqhG family protein [Pseudomonadota bacterium]